MIQVHNLKKKFDDFQALNGVDMHVGKGDIYRLVGPNGAGKSTLMRTLLHLQQPLNGEIVFGDGLHSNEIGYLPQQTVVQKDFPASVREIVLSGCQNKCGFRPFYNKAEKERAAKAIERMGITDLVKRCYRELSGGQQQRVLLARALCATEKVLLLDEPVSGLDPRVTAELYTLIKKLNDEGITIVMISHDVQAALKYATHILHIGQHPFFGTKEDYMNSDIYKSFLSVSGGAENV